MPMETKAFTKYSFLAFVFFFALEHLRNLAKNYFPETNLITFYLLFLVLVIQPFCVILFFLWFKKKKKEKFGQQFFTETLDFWGDDVACIYNSDGAFTFVSASCQRVLGFSPSELINKNLREFIHPNDLESLQKFFTSLSQTKTKKIFSLPRYRFRTKNGCYVWMETQLRTVLSRGRLSVFSLSRNITTLVHSEKLLQSLVDNSLIGVVTTRVIRDEEGNAVDFEYLLVNETAQKDMYSISGVENIVGKRYSEIRSHFPPLDKDKIKQTLEVVLTGKSLESEWNFFVESKKRSDFRVKISKLEDDVVVMTFLDISERIANRDLAQAKLIAENTAKFKDRFLAHMSHEIRTPLNAVVGSIELLERSILNTQQKELISTLRKSSENLLNIINDILILSKLEAGQEKIRSAPISIGQFLQTLKSLYEPLAQQNGNVISIKIDPKLPSEVNVDEQKLMQILSNLVSNAIKFTHNGLIHITASQISTDRLKIEVEDTGIGIKREDLGKLFQTFSQVEQTSIPRGTGLGLAISYQLINLMKGSIDVASIPGVGSKFWITLPYEKSETPSTSPLILKEVPSIQENSLNAHILLVEDNIVSQRIQSLMLKKLGCKVDIASNGLEAIEIFSRSNSKFSLILMDIQMPILNGLETTQRIRCIEGKVIPPIIGLSANACEGDAEECINSGLDDYLAKPVTFQLLQTKLKKWLVDERRCE